MSELKTYKMVDEEYCADCFCVIPSEVYLKSEADKVIAHNKYKRCLAMAKLAVKDDYAQWNMKWHKRWLELAEKFKEDV